MHGENCEEKSNKIEGNRNIFEENGNNIEESRNKQNGDGYKYEDNGNKREGKNCGSRFLKIEQLELGFKVLSIDFNSKKVRQSL